jgi:hypothetical protein
LLYWDSKRLMQNIQDVENSKKIVMINDNLTNKTEKPNLPTYVTLEDEDNDNDGVNLNSSHVD